MNDREMRRQKMIDELRQSRWENTLPKRRMYWREYCQIVAASFLGVCAIVFVMAKALSGADLVVGLFLVIGSAVAALIGSIAHMMTRPWYYADYWKRPED